MQKQHQLHSVLATKYFRIAAFLNEKINWGKPDPELVKAHQDFLEIGEYHARTARLFPECNEFVPMR